jgi:ATP-binding cassette subfamily F protein 3
MGLTTEKMATAAEKLSGGEKARLMMGLAAFGAPQLLILDEPTNHLDIDSREALVHALNDYSGAVILVTHDRHLIEACADRLWLVANGTVEPFDGDIEDYRRQVLGIAPSRERDEAPAEKPQPATSQKEVRREAAQRREALAPLRKKIKDCEKRIEKLRAEIEALDGKLAAPDLYSDPDEAAKLAKARTERVHDFARAESDWLDLSAELEAREAEAVG